MASSIEIRKAMIKRWLKVPLDFKTQISFKAICVKKYTGLLLFSVADSLTEICKNR